MNNKDTIIRAALAGGYVLKEYFGKALNPTEKSAPWDLQTIADLESEKAILAIIQKDFPNYNIHSEEIGKIDNGSEYTFYIDPLDGTSNFTMGVPNFSVSICLIHNGEIVAGAVYSPITNEMYYAEKGMGATLNDKKISVSSVTDPKQIRLAVCFGYKTKKETKLDVLTKLVSSQAQRVMWNWSVANDCSRLAAGKIDCIVNEYCDIYDFGAGKIIAREAGAKIYDWSGKETTEDLLNTFIIANNKDTCNYLQEILHA